MQRRRRVRASLSLTQQARFVLRRSIRLDDGQLEPRATACLDQSAEGGFGITVEVVKRRIETTTRRRGNRLGRRLLDAPFELLPRLLRTSHRKKADAIRIHSARAAQF